MKGLLSKMVKDETAMAFIDDTDFVMEGEDYQNKKQIILNTYTKLF